MPMGRMTLLQIAKIYKGRSENNYLKLKIMPVQQQQGVVDCGLFSIAYATEVCSGMNPVDATFNQKSMRNHLLQCLIAGVMCPFPQITIPHYLELPRPTSRTLNIKLYCLCRMPDNYDEEMILCDHCKRWYHYCCVGVCSKQIPKTWKCGTCSGKNDPCVAGKPVEFSFPVRK